MRQSRSRTLQFLSNKIAQKLILIKVLISIEIIIGKALKELNKLDKAILMFEKSFKLHPDL